MTFDKLYLMFAESFHERKTKGEDCWLSIGLTVPCKLLFDLYGKFILDGIPSIESLNEDKKLFYFNIARKYYVNTKDIIQASKAAYVLSLITSNE